jgi:hypothetical protein
MSKNRRFYMENFHKKTPTPETDVGVSLLNPHNFVTKLNKTLIIAIN